MNYRTNNHRNAVNLLDCEDTQLLCGKIGGINVKVKRRNCYNKKQIEYTREREMRYVRSKPEFAF